MSDYPMLISNKLHSFRNFMLQSYKKRKNRPLHNFLSHANRIQNTKNQTKRNVETHH